MFEQVLLWIYRTTDALGETLPAASGGKSLGDYVPDGAEGFSAWVYQDGNDQKLLAVLEAVGADGGALTLPAPQEYCGRALMAQLLYNMLTK
jgi:hypothetical protein